MRFLSAISPRDEQDLHWRWRFADGEIKSIASPGIGGLYNPIRNVDELRCGPVEVTPKPSHWHETADIDWRAMDAAARARRIDAALRLCSSLSREALWRAYGARIDTPLAQLGGQAVVHESGVLVVQPALCNLVELSPEAAVLHRRAGVALGLRAWLERQSARAAAGKANADLLASLLDGAREVLERAGREYRAARRRA